MCRFLIYKGRQEILLAHLILNPTHSILTQSYDSRLRLDTRRPHNGDGFGIGYYTSPELGCEPCIFTSTTPAWNCNNLTRLAEKTTSSLVFAHVRATTTGQLSESNCHPFKYNSIMFMHNGNIACFPKIKRNIVLDIDERFFLTVEGSTDSEWAFALFLDTLDKLGVDPASVPPNGFGHQVLRQAMLNTITRLNEFCASAGITEPSLLNFAATDGHSVVCTRYVTSRTDEAASLYFSSGTRFHEYKPGGFYHMERHDRGQDLVMVASEPLTFERGDWVTVPTNSILSINKQTVLIHPIIDEFYQSDPSYSRSTQLAESKGLVGVGPADQQAAAEKAEGVLKMLDQEPVALKVVEQTAS
ncbi:putative glutamine amidotransferase DUG3 [Drechslerella stenobrocha 248]|uniref:Putative glutamine amidotransferase DUG3 n=1 Tax=Drechslerella stenobrocha 248 TaxID=1043628 RepID=W7HVG0_9PEZI|nr:putative glutamine amidotransferase DUG3 [Drechslerella stenobrocha 248]